MKMAVILGVTQMCVGICLKALNAIHFRQELDLIFEFIPQIVLMLSLFGYLCFLIIYKWCIPYAYNGMNGIEPGPQSAPMLLNTMIYMFLSPFSIDKAKVPPLFDLDTQAMIQGILVILAGVSVPLMLLPKPFILRYRHNKAKQHYDVIDNRDDSEDGGHAAAPSGGGGHGHGEEFDFGEIMVHQVIETIEFVLGSVSNTASYLRLWALSLAHSELSTVFWDMGLMQLGVGLGPVGVVIIFAVWFGVTILVLCIMETLSAFLHALRLHWVEFQNKFYKGDGKKFMPFSYERMFSGEDDI
jgi:V-type H+-transporting ATPase subunit a